MKNTRIVLVTLLILYMVLTIFPYQIVHAQSTSFDVSTTFDIADSAAQEGDILVPSDKGLVRVTDEASNVMFGVLQPDSPIVFKSDSGQQKPVSRNGIAKVNVTTLNGDIKSGDRITSSIIPGKGEKALHSGYVLGTALQNFTHNDGNKINANGKQISSGQILVAIRIEYAEIDTARSVNRLFEYLNSAIFQNLQNPQQTVKIIQYISAGSIVLIGFVISFLAFTRSIAKSIEAIGRNPAARRSIQFAISLNSILTVVIVIISVIASIIILRL